MMAVSLDAIPSQALDEDLRTAWAPDVARNNELDEYPPEGGSMSWQVQRLYVPRPTGAFARASILHPQLHLKLHQAVAPLRAVADEILAMGVSGYRRGAEAGSGYSDAYRQMRRLFDEFAETAEVVVFADVEQFFSSVRPPTLRRALSAVVDEQELDELFRFFDRMTELGLPALPPGYADARLIGNLVLHQADGRIAVPFTRWVDDYRLFVRHEHEAAAVIASLEEALLPLGLRLNRGKTRVMPINEARLLARDTLGSVYHPDRDPPERVRANLRAVLRRAAKDPVSHRRAYRFVLPRLAREGDAIAIPFALETLRTTPWDAPRAIAYLEHFLDRPKVRRDLRVSLRAAAVSRDVWLLGRIAPLAMRMDLDATTLDVLSAALPELRGTPAWGLVLRTLAQHGRAATVQSSCSDQVSDARAAIAACVDLELDYPEGLRHLEPVLAESLDRAPAPLPASDSLL